HPEQQASVSALGSDSYHNNAYVLFDDENIMAQQQQPPTRKRRTNKEEPAKRGTKRTAMEYDNDGGPAMATTNLSKQIARLSKVRRTDQHPPPETKTQSTQGIQPPSDPINCLDNESDDDRIERVPKFSVIDIPLSVRAQAFLPSFNPMPMMPCYPHNKEPDEENAKESPPTTSNNALVLYSPQSFDVEDKASSMDVD
ncbi:hypothetical protein LPJ59_006436, partial [Coemansia sp. RSA 2399]